MRKRTGTGLSSLWYQTGLIIQEMNTWIVKTDGCRALRTKIQKPDQARLLILRVWSLRHHVEMQELLSLVMRVLRLQRRSRKPISKGSLGITIRTLTGEASEQILIEELRRKYPGHENVAEWNARERERQLQAEAEQELDGLSPRQKPVLTVLQCHSTAEFVEQYRQHIEERRKLEEVPKWRKRKRYRYNPWI